MVTREQVRQSIFDLTHYWDDTYGVDNWGNISQKERDTFIIEQYRQGVPAMQIAKAMKIYKLLNGKLVYRRVFDRDIKSLNKFKPKEEATFWQVEMM